MPLKCKRSLKMTPFLNESSTTRARGSTKARVKIGRESSNESEFTPVPLYNQTKRLPNYSLFWEKAKNKFLRSIVKPESPTDWEHDPNLTDLEEEYFFRDVINFPTSKVAYILPRQRRKDMVKKKNVKVQLPTGEIVVKTHFCVELVESETVFIIEVKGSLVNESLEKVATAKANNEKYLEMVKRKTPGLFADDEGQTFTNTVLSTHTDYKIQGCCDTGTQCHYYHIVDEYNHPDNQGKSGESQQEVSFWEAASEDDVPSCSEEDTEFDIKIALDEVYKKRKHTRLQNLRLCPDISFSVIALERVMSMDLEQDNQADMRGFSPLVDYLLVDENEIVQEIPKIEAKSPSSQEESLHKDSLSGEEKAPEESPLFQRNMTCSWTQREEKAAEEKSKGRTDLIKWQPRVGQKIAKFRVTTPEPVPTHFLPAKGPLEFDMAQDFPELDKILKSRGKSGQEIVDLVEEVDDVSSRTEDSHLSDHKWLMEDSEESFDFTRSSNFPQAARASSFETFTQDNTKTGPFLKLFCHFKCALTSKKQVTDIALHPRNGNLIAVSYGSYNFGEEKAVGFVGVWNAKNSLNPERSFHPKSPTCLAFSEFKPYILAVGTLSGDIVLYDIRHNDETIIISTLSQPNKHLGPVWQIYWLVEEERTLKAAVSESLLSLGHDGYLKKWSLSNTLQSKDIMKVYRSTLPIGGRKEKPCESLMKTLSSAFTLCFFPDNAELFLLGTEEGFIHKCSTAYKNQFVSTYQGHSGPVYRTTFSSFDETLFISCGGDWTIKIWKTDQTFPLLSLNTGLRTVFDTTWSLYSSTVFISCAEFHLEVWDLSVNTLRPVIRQPLPNTRALRKVVFSGCLNSVIIGDDDGAVYIFGLKNFPSPQIRCESQSHLLQALIVNKNE